MAFPRIPRDKRRNIKIKTHQIPEIIDLHESGWSERRIAAKFGVSKYCISYYLMTREQKDELRMKKVRYERDRDKVRKSARDTYLHRKKVIGKDVLNHNNLLKIKQYIPERRLEAWQFHKEKLEQLLESDPLLILFRSKKDKVTLTLSK